LYTHVVRNDPAFLVGHASIQPRTDARNLNHFLDVKVAMKDRVIERQILYFVLRENPMHLVAHILPFVLAPEIIQKKKPASQNVFAQPLSLVIRELQIPGLHKVDQWIIEQLFVENWNLLRLGGDVQIGSCPISNSDYEMIVGFRIVDGPGASSSPAVEWRVINRTDECELTG